MNADFNHFFDSVLIEAASRQTGQRVEWLLVRDLCLAADPNAPPTWVEMVEDRIRALGYGRLVRDTEKPGLFWFKLNGVGLSRVHEARAQRAVPTAGVRLRNANWPMWSALVAVLALIAYVIVEIVKN